MPITLLLNTICIPVIYIIAIVIGVYAATQPGGGGRFFLSTVLLCSVNLGAICHLSNVFSAFHVSCGAQESVSVPGVCLTLPARSNAIFTLLMLAQCHKGQQHGNVAQWCAVFRAFGIITWPLLESLAVLMSCTMMVRNQGSGSIL